MSDFRPPTLQELAIIAKLVQHDSRQGSTDGVLPDFQVKSMSDGGMGSLLLFPHGCSESVRVFGATVASGQFTDSDGVAVLVTLNSDQQGQLFELDVWKVNFTPLCSWPDSSAVRIEWR